MVSYCQSDSQYLLLAVISSLPFLSSFLSPCEAQAHRKQLWKLLCPISSSVCLRLFLCSWRQEMFKVCSVSLVLLGLFVCVCLYVYKVTHMQWRPQVLPNVQRKEKNGRNLLLLIPSLFQFLEFSPSCTVHLFSFLPPNHTLSSFYFKLKHRYLSLSLFSSSSCFFPHSSVFLSLSISFLADAQLLVCGLRAPLITQRTLCGRKTAKLISRANWQPETEMMSSRLSCMDGVTRQIPGFFCGYMW